MRYLACSDVVINILQLISVHIIIIIRVGFIERKIDTNPLMRLSPRRESPETDMGRHLKSASQGITKVGGIQIHNFRPIKKIPHSSDSILVELCEYDFSFLGKKALINSAFV